MLHGLPGRPSLQPYMIWRHQLLAVDIYEVRKNGRKFRLPRLRVEFLENGKSEGHKILNADLGTAGLTNLPGVTSLAASSRLQNAIKYCTKVAKCVKRVRTALRRIIRSRFDARSPVMTHWIWPNVSRDCKVECRAVLPCPANWWASCFCF